MLTPVSVRTKGEIDRESINSTIVSRLVARELRGTYHIAKAPPIWLYHRYHKVCALKIEIKMLMLEIS